MFGNGNYPPGAENDPNAPYNQSAPKPEDFDVTVVTTLSKETVVSTSNYDFEGGVDEEGIYGSIVPADVNWKEEYSKDYYTALELIELFKKELENKMSTLTDVAERSKCMALIENCTGWTEDEIEVIYE